MNVRQSNFELLRIIAILLVLVLHADFFALQGPSAQDIVSSPVDSSLRILFQSVSIMAVNIFVMISGWFGIRQSRRGFGNLLFQTFYYLILVYAVMLAGGWATFSGNGIKDLFMVNSSNWFIKAYILLYILAPVLNTFVEHCSRKKFSHVLCGFFIFQSLYGWLFPKSTEYICGGYSTISFIGLYLLAKYIRIYSPRWTELNKKTDVLIIVAITVFTTVICVIGPLSGTSAVYGYMFLTYVSPTTILMATMTIVLFSKLNFKSRLVNRLAASSFAVYLIFVNPNILSRYGQTFDEIHSFCNIAFYWPAVIAICIILYLAVAVADTIRIRIWNTIIYRKNIFELSRE